MSSYITFSKIHTKVTIDKKTSIEKVQQLFSFVSIEITLNDARI